MNEIAIPEGVNDVSLTTGRHRTTPRSAQRPQKMSVDNHRESERHLIST